MKLFITKYALTNGIEEVEGTLDRGCASTHDRFTRYFYGNDWHLTREKAITRAEQMRVSKIASLKKQITKLEGLKFV